MMGDADRSKTGAKAIEPGKVYEYYREKSVLPTFGDLRDELALDRYVEGRAELLAGKLLLPLRIFQDAHVLEFGPDTGENALAFARLGACLTLVEPNAKALEQIEKYFKGFGLEKSLNAIIEADVAGFRSKERFDVIDAEGFIYTIQPPSDWLGAFQRLLKDDGVFVISYYTRHGGILELCLKAIHCAACDMAGQESQATAWRLYEAKWNSIPHTRSFDSWVMDVIENPYVRADYFIDPATLCQLAADYDFRLHSSWPVYRDHMQVYWHKDVVPAARQLEIDADHIRRSSLSYLTGRKLYLAASSPDEATRVSGMLDALIGHVDSLIDGPDEAALSRTVDMLSDLGKAVPKLTILSDRPQAVSEAVALLSALERAFRLICDRDLEALVGLTNGDADFIGTWGMPAHFAVFRKSLG